jgi:N-acetylneuraminate synthase
MEKLNLAGRFVSSSEPPYIIAEIGSNHNGDMDLCKRLIDAALISGADAVKFQSWSKTSIISAAEYKRNTSYEDKKKHFGSLEEMVEKYQLTPEQHFEAADYCRERGITFLSSCFTRQEVDLLDELNVAAFKIASMDINHLLLLEYVAKKKRPVILSTGMATLGEIERAIDVLKKNGSQNIALMHCIAVYPPTYEQINLRNIISLQKIFDMPIGFSDHSLGTSIPLAAIAIGACIIEKHFTLDKDMVGWDHAISANPTELSIIVQEGRNVFSSLGSFVRTVYEDEIEKRKKFRRRLVVTKALQKSHKLQLEDIDFKRPGTGIHPDEYYYVLGRVLNRDVHADEEIKWDDLV